MKKLLTVLLVLLLFRQGQSQIVFCPPGAEWHYSFKTQFPPPYEWNNETIKYMQDSVLGNETVKVLGSTRLFKTHNMIAFRYTLIKQNGDTVFFRNIYTNHNWQILYNYAALAGQSWTNTINALAFLSPPTPTFTYTVTVDSVKTVSVNSFPLRRLYARYSRMTGSVPVITTDTVCIDERLGCSQFLFNFYCYQWNSEFKEFFQEFLCYSDNAFGTAQISEKPCNYTDLVGIQENSYQEGAVRIYPNPGSGVFQVELPRAGNGEETRLTVTDISGRKVKHLLLNPDNTSHPVDLSQVDNGLYIISVCRNNNILYSGKALKQ